MRKIVDAASPRKGPLRRTLRTQLYTNIGRIIELFELWDKNHDGLVTPGEFRKALVALEFELLCEEEFQKLWDHIDTDKSGAIELRELKDAIEMAARPPRCPPVAPPSHPRVLALREVYGDTPTDAERELAHRMELVQSVEIMKTLGEIENAAAVESLETQTFKAGEVVFNQGDDGDACYFITVGECYASKYRHEFEEGQRVEHKKRGIGTVTEVTDDPDITRVLFDAGDEHRYGPSSLHKLKRVTTEAFIAPKIIEVAQYRPGGNQFFGERALLRSEPRAVSITCRTDVTVLRLSAATFVQLKRQQDHKEDLLRGVELFENFNDDQIGDLADVLRLREFHEKEAIIVQGEEGHHFYILDAGECAASIQDGHDTQVVKHYSPGELFGEKALLENAKRAATVMAVSKAVRVWTLSRAAFESKLGPLNQLHAEQYLTDPRRLIADFYRSGDSKGPAGTLPPGTSANTTAWFAVYRPCSRDSIAKMLGRVGVGKGLNIKGKSAKKNRLSGFVPFCQISKNEHKSALEHAPSDARTRIFYQSEEAMETARAALNSALVELQAEKGAKLKIDEQEVRVVSQYAPESYGLDVPELLMREVYIVRPDISPTVGYETGRDSEPAFLDMNLHSLRGGSSPNVVLYQFDKRDAMNPLGMLMAYAEAEVKPVVSDFDTLLVGSRGVRYEMTPPDQVELMQWALDHTAQLLADPTTKGWMGRWLNVLKDEARKGFHPTLPKYGFGDPTSYGLIGSIVDAMAASGAVRHGAECFNFYFPQELDAEFLVVWDGLDSPPWKAVKEPELRAFLLERAKEGFSFPVNPVWPVRDAGWLEVLQALQQQEEASKNLQSWFPPASGIVERIEQLHAAYPEGFVVKRDTDDSLPKAPLNGGGNGGGKNNRRASFFTNMIDAETRDMANLADNEMRRELKARYRRIRVAVKVALKAEAVKTQAD